MGGGAVGGAGAARGDAVAVAVATVAEEGAAFEDFAGAQGFQVLLAAVLGQAVGVCSPLPDVADDVVEAVAVGSKRTRGRGGEPAVAPAVVAGEVTLPDATVGAQFVEIQASGDVGEGDYLGAWYGAHHAQVFGGLVVDARGVGDAWSKTYGDWA